MEREGAEMVSSLLRNVMMLKDFKSRFMLFGAMPLIALSLSTGCQSHSSDVADSLLLLEQQLEATDYVHSIMVEDPSHGAYARWEAKEVKASRPLVITESLDNILFRGVGSISYDAEMTRSGHGSVRIDCPTSTEKKNPTNRNYGTPEMIYTFDHEDLSEWNRISMWVYVDAPGFFNAFVSFKVFNEGEHVMPVPGRFEGEHCITVHPGEWRHIMWEIPDIYRDCVTGISANVMMFGETSSSANHMKLYVDDIALENIEVENTRGFDLRSNAIAYSHSGYKCGFRKEALVQGTDAKSFTIVDADKGKVAFKGACTHENDGFSLLDFTALDKSGKYYIEVGDIKSGVFAIGEDAYRATAWRGVNFFFHERCGYDLPGVHEACHKDVLIYHPDGRMITFAGGWHDAADLTQGPGNDNESIIALLELAAATKETALKERALEEARWGLNWILGTRFGDGYRAGGLIIGIWTDNIVGTKDDMSTVAVRDAETNFRCAEALALAAKAFADRDTVFSRWCANAAVADFGFAREDMDESDTRLDFNTFMVASALRLYSLTSEKQYLDFAAARMKVVLSALQMDAKSEWKMPLRGFFYEDASCSRIQAYYHQSQEHRAAQDLAMLLAMAPDHADAALWMQACEAMGDYYRSVSDVMAPYGLLPAAVYEVDNTDYSHLYHEGDRVGLPSIEEYNAQVRNGIALADSVYLRRFPVAYQFRGFNAVALSKSKAAFVLAGVLHDQKLADIASRQVEWVLGFNPYASSTVFGDGYDYHLIYDACAGHVVGSVPVGIETWENEDKPCWPTQVNATYKEIWTHSTARLMSCVAELISCSLN